MFVFQNWNYRQERPSETVWEREAVRDDVLDMFSPQEVMRTCWLVRASLPSLPLTTRCSVLLSRWDWWDYCHFGGERNNISISRSETQTGTGRWTMGNSGPGWWWSPSSREREHSVIKRQFWLPWTENLLKKTKRGDSGVTGVICAIAVPAVTPHQTTPLPFSIKLSCN